MRNIYWGAFLSLFSWVFAQNPVSPTSATVRMDAYEQRIRELPQSLVADVPLRNIGPTIMSGRVVDVEVNPQDPTQFYVAYASGSVFFTQNNGASFQPIFDDQATPTIGDIAVDWARKVIWVGTGESNSSRSSYAGTGVYRSSDGGKTWQHLGLSDTHHIGRVVLHPQNPNVVWVAALGHLYSPNAERGVFKTEDGGKTWKKVLFINEDTGAIDLTPDPKNPNTLYAAMWYRTRRAWNFVESGETSGIYKSVDGGKTWALLTKEGAGFPTGKGVGRIGLATSADGKWIYALLDNQFRRPKKEASSEEGLTKDRLRAMTKEAFLALKPEDVKTYLSKYRFPKSYTVERITQMVERDEIKPEALVTYLEDANQQLFDTDVIGAELYRSSDGGKTWKKTHDGYLDETYFTYGYYFGNVRVSPQNPEQVYILAYMITTSKDGGKTFQSLNGPNVHADHHALWANPNRAGHLINGNDGGLNISYDNGETWFKINTPSVGQFYTVTYDMAKPYRVYGGLQDNGVWFGPSDYEMKPFAWMDEGRYPYQSIGGGDGMQVQVDFRDNKTVYYGSQFGFYQRRNTETGAVQSVRPRHQLGERPLRFNWQTPILLSRHHQDILYFGAQKLFRSMDQGATFEAISDDLTGGAQAGNVPYGTLTTLDESPLQFGLIYTGSDDGLIHVTQDGGVTWQRISDSLPQHLWVSRVRASRFEKGTVYATLNGYRWDHFAAYVYQSKDFGKTWTRLGLNLPQEPVNVILEDPVHSEFLYVGTDLGVYASLDGGNTFHAFQEGFPHTPVHDLAIQPEAQELIVGTHGRSLFTLDLTPIHALTAEVLAKGLYMLPAGKVTLRDDWGKRTSMFGKVNEPVQTLQYYAQKAGELTVQVKDPEDKLLKTWKTTARMGLNRLSYDLTMTQDAAENAAPAENGLYYLKQGVYTITISGWGTSAETKLQIVKPDARKEPEPDDDGEPD